MVDRRQPRVLVIAEAANPEWVSVPLVGWAISSALREVADVHLVTQVRNRDAVVRAGLIEGRDVTVIDSEAVARPMHRLGEKLRMGEGKGWTTVSAVAALSYPYFEHLVWRQFGSRIRAGEWDVVHRVTPLSPTTSSSLAKKVAKAGVPFVLGPLNGGVPWPTGFQSERHREREWLSYVRGAYKLNPSRLRMLSATSAIVVGSRHTATEMPARVQHRVVYVPENGIDPHRFNLQAEQRAEGPLRACFVGRLVPYKGLGLVLDAAQDLLRSGQMVLDVVGDGPLRGELEQRCRDSGLTDAVTFHGHLPHDGVGSVLVQSHVLTFPSIREFGGGVVLEAMTLGVVPVVVDYAGPGELVTEETGIRLPIGSPDSITSRLRAELEGLVEDREPLREMGQAARRRVDDHFTWSAKARQIAKIYDWVTHRSSKAPAPDFFNQRP